MLEIQLQHRCIRGLIRPAYSRPCPKSPTLADVGLQIPCRRRKVRCDLGPVDEPHEPPCVRCRREAKECYFSATRRKRKADSEDGQSVGEGPLDEDHAARLARKKGSRSSGSYNRQPLPHGLQSPDSRSLPAASPLEAYDLRREGGRGHDGPYATKRALGKAEDGQDQEVSNETAAALFQSPINVPGDALHLLLKASDESEHMQRRDIANVGRRSTSQSVRNPSIAHGRYDSGHSSRHPVGQNYPLNIDPAISGSTSDHDGTTIPVEALKLWSRLRFVRAGWFTAKEAISYVD